LKTDLTHSVVVIGATGMLGAPVTNGFVRERLNVTALVRSPEKAGIKLHTDIRIQKGDLTDKESLVTAFKGKDSVYLNLSTGPKEKDQSFKTEIDGIQNVIEAAGKTGIKRIGYLSSLVSQYQGIDWWVFDMKRKACRMLLDSDIPVTIFYPSNFFENFPAYHMVGNQLILFGEQKSKSWWVGTKDYAKQASNALKQNHNENREYPVQGHEPMSYGEAAEVFSSHYSYKKLKKRIIPLKALKMLGKFSARMDYTYNLLYAINHFDEQFQSEITWRELGKPRLRLAEFTRSL
jgi:uncharacterized protein YbjT (DUF2867 family)